MAGHNALVRKFKQFNGSPPALRRVRMWPVDRAGAPAAAGRKSLIDFHDTHARPAAWIDRSKPTGSDRRRQRGDRHGADRACGKGNRVGGDASIALDVTRLSTPKSALIGH